MKSFSNIRVLDLTHVLAGPFCTYQLAMLGAEVIKIEPVSGGDMMRDAGPVDQLADQQMGIMYLAQSAGKKSLCLDIQTEEGRSILRKLVCTADVLVENYRGGVLDDLGLGYRELSALNPGLIYCSVTGFGKTGPKAKHPAYDNVIQAFSGMMHSTGTPQSGPVKVGPPVLDYGTGAQAALAIAAALFQRERDSKGQKIDVSMLDAALMLMSSQVAATAYTSDDPVRAGNDNPSNAGYSCYETADGLLMVGAYTAKQLERLWRVLDQEDKATAVATMDRHQIAATADADRQQLAEIFLQQPAPHWEALLNDAGVPAARVRSLTEALDSEQVETRGVVQTVANPLDRSLSIRVPVAAFVTDRESPAPERAPPFPAQHSSELLTELGFDDDQIANLAKSGVVTVC